MSKHDQPQPSTLLRMRGGDDDDLPYPPTEPGEPEGDGRPKHL